jgi:hypothetical protein
MTLQNWAIQAECSFLKIHQRASFESLHGNGDIIILIG